MTHDNHDNKGFSLVELIVVIAILGILAGAASFSVSTVSANRARKAAQAVKDMLSQCKVLTLSGAEAPTMTVTLEGGKYYATLYLGSVQREREMLGGTNLSIAYTQEGVTANVSSSVHPTLSFHPSTGALSQTCTAITVGNYTVSITPSTGYHTVTR